MREKPPMETTPGAMVKRLFGTLIRALGQRPKYFSECPFQSFKKVFTSAYLLLNQPQTSTIFFAAFSFTLSHIALQSIFYFRWGSNQRTLMKQDRVQTIEIVLPRRRML